MAQVQLNSPATGERGAPSAQEALLSVRNLSIAFNDGSDWFSVLTDVSFAVMPGETVGVVGESGCGKSLTALSILGLLPRRGCRRTGEILFEGRDLVQASARPTCARCAGAASA